jgi:hypothetical protein
VPNIPIIMLGNVCARNINVFSRVNENSYTACFKIYDDVPYNLKLCSELLVFSSAPTEN